MYLRQFKHLRLVNLAGNPFCKEHDYKWVSQILNPTYLCLQAVFSNRAEPIRYA